MDRFARRVTVKQRPPIAVLRLRIRTKPLALR